MQAMIDQLIHRTQLRWNKVHKFEAKINFNFELGSYIVKTADTPEELVESFRLRDEVFNQEFRGIGKVGLDLDKYDFHFDHLIIVQKDLNKIIGTYRLNCSADSKGSYTASEFDLKPLFFKVGPFLELGRACIHKDFRKGSVISLLWRGITEYMKLSEAGMLFGCSSIKVNNARDAALIFKFLQETNQVETEFQCLPTKKYKMPDLDSWSFYFRNGLNLTQKEEAKELIPSLLNSYLKLGAKIAGPPAFDASFDCIDLLTILKKEDLAESLVKRFQVVR